MITNIYLPIASIGINITYMCVIGFVNGLFSGIIGVSGSFITIPIMIILGIPSSVAVSNTVCSLLAISIYAGIKYYNNHNIDFKIAHLSLIGIVAGIVFGAYILTILNELGIRDFIVIIIYIMVLSTSGMIMLTDAIKTFYMIKLRRFDYVYQAPFYNYFKKWPMSVYSKKLKKDITALLPIACGCVAGLAFSVCGIATGFIMIPALIYLAGYTTIIAIGTSIYNGLCASIIMVSVNFLKNNNADIVLSCILMVNAMIGVYAGVKLSYKLTSIEFTKLFLSIGMIFIIFKLVLSASIEPNIKYIVR